MRKYPSIIAGLMLVFSFILAACGGAENPSASLPPTAAQIASSPTAPAAGAGEATATTDPNATAPDATPAGAEATPVKSDTSDGTTNPDATPAEAEATPVKSDTPGGTADGAMIADLGFRPEVNGFSFENYGGDKPVTNLTPAEVRRMFGDQVCASLQGDTCILIPPAQQWMEQNNASMSGGHCEGFAALSLLLYSGQIDPKQFGGGTVADLKLDGNELLQREIAYWFTTQATQPARNAIIHGTPAEIVEMLKTAYAKDNTSHETYAVGIYKPDRTGGHAVSAYGIEDQGQGVYWIMIYDNNYPGQPRHIQVDTQANTWQYEAAINPQVASELYQGDAGTNTLEIVPTSARLGQQMCDFCAQSSTSQGRVPGLAAPAAQHYNEVWMEGDAAFLVMDKQGRKLGYAGGTFVNEIPEASFARVKGQSLAEQDVAPTYYLPVDMEFSLVIDGDSIAKKEDNATDAVVIGPGYYIGVEGIYLDPGQKDTLKLAGDGRSIAYKTDYSESPTMIVGIERPAADFELELKGKDIKPGSETIVAFDPDKGTLTLRSSSDEDGSFYVAITRIDDNGEQTFESGDEDVVLKPGDVVSFNFGAWDGQGHSLEVQFDDGGDGTVDQTMNINDQK